MNSLHQEIISKFKILISMHNIAGLTLSYDENYETFRKKIENVLHL